MRWRFSVSRFFFVSLTSFCCSCCCLFNLLFVLLIMIWLCFCFSYIYFVCSSTVDSDEESFFLHKKITSKATCEKWNQGLLDIWQNNIERCPGWQWDGKEVVKLFNSWTLKNFLKFMADYIVDVNLKWSY